MKSNIISFLVFIIASTTVLLAQIGSEQEPLRMRYGVFADFNINMHSTNFTKLPGVPNCCPDFRGGKGTGHSLGVLFEMPFSDKFLFSVRAGWFNISGLFKESEPKKVLLPNDSLIDGEYEYSIDAGLSTISLEPMFGSRLFDYFFLYVGLNLGLLIQHDFAQKEQTTYPYHNDPNQDIRKITSSDTSGILKNVAGYLLSLKVGTSYELPLNRERTLLAAPEVYYTYGLTNIVKGLKWIVSSLSMGVVIKF